MARAVQPMTAISPKQLLDAEQTAIDDYLRAFGPMPVKQPDGTHMQLCWYGRIDRAFDMLASAKGTSREPTIQNALSALMDASKQAQIRAHKSAEHYESLCAQLGTTAKDVVPQSCKCDYCSAQDSRFAATSARADLAQLLSSLFRAQPDKLPALVDMVDRARTGDTSAPKALTDVLNAIADAMRTYYQLCSKSGIQPDWRVY